MTAGHLLLELRTYKKRRGAIFREVGSPTALQASMADDIRDVPVCRLKLKIDSALADARDQHFCTVADKLLAAGTELRKQAKERLGIETEGAGR